MPNNRFNARLPPIYMPTTTSLPHTFIYSVLAADQRNRQVAAAYASPSATMPVTYDTASLPARGRTANSPISPLAAFPPLARTTRRLAETHATFKASLLGSFFNHSTSTKNRFLLFGVFSGELCCLRRPHQLCFDAYGGPAEQSYNLSRRPCRQ